MNIGPLRGFGQVFLRNGEILGHSPIHIPFVQTSGLIMDHTFHQYVHVPLSIWEFCLTSFSAEFFFMIYAGGYYGNKRI